LKPIKPIAYRISQFGSCTEIVYKCPVCNTSFHIYGSDELFCHTCGQAIDWNVVQSLNKPCDCLSDLGAMRQLMKLINEHNNKADEDD